MNKKPDGTISIETETESRFRVSPVRILEVIGNAFKGGMENYLKNFIQHLPREQFRVTCICPYESPFTSELRQLGVEEVYITPIDDDPRWRSIQLAVEVARLHKIDVLHAHMPRAHVLAGLAGTILKRPVAATIHGMNISTQELGIHRAVNSYLTTNCTEAYTQALALGVQSNRITLIKNGVEIPVLTAEKNDKLRRFLGLSDSTPLIGFVGRLDHEKGPDVFLRVAEFVHHKKPDVHFVFVGDGAMNEELQELTARYNLNNHVHFAGWWSNAADIYPSIDILAHTSRSDGTSLVLLEAMSFGCATIAIAVGGIREIISDGYTGMLMGAGDWEGVAHGILHLLNKPKLVESMKSEARKRVEEHFNVKTNTMLTANILKSLVNSSVYSRQQFSNNNKKAPLKPAIKPPLKSNGNM